MCYFLGMLHAGIGSTHVNALLTSMNLPPVGVNSFKAREREIGPAIESVAKNSCEKALEAEKMCPLIEDGNTETIKIAASYNMGWQKRGKAHKALQVVTLYSGHGHSMKKIRSELILLLTSG